MPGWHFQIFKGSSPALRSATWLPTHWQATRSINGIWPYLMDSGDGVQLLGAARTTKVKTQPSGHFVKYQTKQFKKKCLWTGGGFGGKGLEVQLFLQGLNSKQKLGSLNKDLIHSYFLVRDYQPTKQLIHGCILSCFFSLFSVCFSSLHSFCY